MPYESDVFKCNHCPQVFSRNEPHVLHYRYGYFNGDTKHPYEWKTCNECAFTGWIQKRRSWCSYRCSKLGNNNPSKGKKTEHGMTKTEYVRLHEAVRKQRGKAFGCVHCGILESDRMYHWANITGNYGDVYDYMNLCVPCHDKFDRTKNK